MRTAPRVALVLLATACGHARPQRVAEVDVSKLSPAMASQLETARKEMTAAQGELPKLDQQLSEARQEEARGKAEAKSADAAEERAKKLADDAKARSRAADARRGYAEKLVEARQADAEAAKRRIELADAKLELVKLQALQQSSPQAVVQYDQSQYYARVAETQRRFDEAVQKARSLDAEAKAEQRAWQELAAKAPAEAAKQP